MKRNFKALGYLVDNTIYNVISTPFSIFARAWYEGKKYFNYFSAQANDKKASNSTKALAYIKGGTMFLVGGMVGTVKEVLLAVKTQANTLNTTTKIILGFGIVGNSRSYENAVQIYNRIVSQAEEKFGKDQNRFVKNAVAFTASITAGVAYFGSMVTVTPYSNIKNSYNNFLKNRINRLSDATYLAKGDYALTIGNMAYAPVEFAKNTVYNVVGSFKSIPTIMNLEAKRYYKWASENKTDFISKFKGLVTGIGGFFTGLVEGLADTLAYQAEEVSNLAERLGGNRQYIKANKIDKNDQTEYVEIHYRQDASKISVAPVLATKYQDFTKALKAEKVSEEIGISYTR